ncbi:MAG: ATP-grasp domain-containing protein [Bacteroidota bacterium]
MKTEHYGGLGIMRSLGRLGVRMFGIDKTEFSPALQSRYCSHRFVWDLEQRTTEESLNFLRSVVYRTGPFPILIPTSDETMMFVANHAQTLKQWFQFTEQPAELILSLYDKKEMFALAKNYNIPVPRTVFPTSLDDVTEFARNAVYPLLVKGIDGKELEKKTGKKMVIVRNTDDLIEQYLLMEDPDHPNVMIQEYIPGGDDDTWIFNGYFNTRSVPLVSFTGKKLRQNPIYTGMTSLGISEYNESVIELAVRFMQSVGYKGIVDIDFRYDARDDTYKILDVNPRVGATFRMFVGRNGMDVVRAMYLDMTRQQVYPTVQQENRKWVVEDKDLLSSYRYFKDGALSLMEWVKSINGIDEAGYFSFNDPKPFLYLCRNHIRRRIAKIFPSKKDLPPSAKPSVITRPEQVQKASEIPQDIAQENV